MPKFKFKIIASITLSFVLLFSSISPLFADYAIPNNTAPKYQRDKFSTDIFTGTANYSYPITVPKGTNDLTPDISLNYNSAGVRDFRMYGGLGWLLNHDYIERDINNTPTNDNDDKFKLRFKGSVHDLVYVAADSRFHTKIESNLKIEKIDTGSATTRPYWQVTTPDGTKYRFGYEAQSELECNERSYITSWNLDLVTDTNNNNIYYAYTEVYGMSYLQSIRYNNDQSRIIYFNYESSPSTRPVYLQGCYVFDPDMLDNVEVFIDEDLVREYDLTYTYANNSQPLLSSVIEKGNDRSNYLTTTFEYNDEVRSWNTTHETWINHAPLAAHLDQTNVTLSDVNGDGLADIVKSDINGINVTWRVLFNQGNSWSTTFVDWISNAGINANIGQSYTRLMDVTGDGLPDIVRAPDADVWQVFRNTGTNWNTTAENWTNLSGIDGSIKLTESDVTLADMTGDGLPDIVHTKAHNGGYQWEVFRNTGSGWSTTREVWHDGTNMPVGFGNPQVRVIDVNNDGLSDVVRTVYDGSLSTWYVWLNTGSGLRGFTIWLDDYVNAHFQNTESTIADANGDGMIDIIRNEDFGSADRWKVLVSTGDHWTNQWDNWIETTANVDADIHNNNTKMADVTGDGLVDIVKGYDDCGCNNETYKVWKNNGNAPHLLKKVTTERGGVISFEYKPSTIYDNDGGDSVQDLPFPLWVVSKMTVTNGLANAQATSDVTTYNYIDGLYKWDEKELRGFKTVETVEPNGSKKRHLFHQGLFAPGQKGKLLELQTRDSQDNPYAEVEYLYENVTTNGIHSANLLQEKHYTYDGTATTPKVKQIDYLLDAYGNVTKKSEQGDTSVTGDERFTYTEFTYNTTDWIVNTPKKTYLHAANDSTKLSENSFYYDNNLLIGDAPTKGNLTKEVKWTNGLFTTDPTTTYVYDAFGNQIEVTDANDHTTYIDYDPSGTYPTYTANAKAHEEYVNYDLGTGNLLHRTDPNGNATNYEYDQFGRITKEIKPYDASTSATVKYQYFTSGVDGTLVSKKEASNSAGTVDTYTWIDGLGRTIQTRTDAENSAKQNVTNTYYDPTGQVKEVTVPHEDDHYDYYRDPLTGIKKTSTTYDVLGRPSILTNPQGDNKTIAYDHWKETTVDENGNIKREFKNAFNKIAKIEEVNDTATYTTTYTYDSRDLLTKITDHEANDITFVYDALGRKTSMTDPDMGTWSYEYDAVGNLTEQTDNRGIAVIKTYDEINRLKKTDYPTETDVVYTYDGNNKKGTLTSVTDAAGTVAYTYDNRLRKTAESRTVGGVTKTTQLAYDPLDRVTTQTNPDNEVITNTFNNQGEIDSVSNVVSNINYNALGKITQKNFDNGLTTNYTYNTNDFRLRRIYTANLQDSWYTYDNVGNVTSIDDGPKTQTFTYDDLDRLKTASESAGYNHSYDYSPIGNLTKFTDSGAVTDYGYGSNGKPHAMTSSTEKVSPAPVNGSGTPFTASITDNWDAGLNTSKWNDWGGVKTSFNVNGQMTIQSNISGGFYGIDSDVQGKLYDLTGSSIVHELVSAGNQNLASWEVYPIYAFVDGDTSTQYFYQIKGNVLKAFKKVNGTNTQLVSVPYNATNHRWFRITEWDGTTYFDVSADGDIWNEIASTANAFDVTGLVIGAEINSGSEASTTTAVFDNFNYATAPAATLTEDWASGSINATKWLNWGGNKVSVLSQELRIVSVLAGGYFGIDSDVSGKMYSLANSHAVNKVVNAGNQNLDSWEVYPLYVYPSDGSDYQYYFYISDNKVKAYKKVDGSDTQLATATYNATNHKWFRIRESGGTTYFDTSADGGTWSNFASSANEFDMSSVGIGVMAGTWDSEGSTTNAKFDNFNVWSPVYKYDANGNMTSDGYKCYIYNEANQMSKVKECGNNHTIAEYVYDYNGLRMVKKNFVSGTLSNTVVSWSDGYETRTAVGGSPENMTYYWVNKELLAKKDANGDRFFYHNDHLGSASILTDANGGLEEKTAYDPWGKVKLGGTTSKFQYTGQEKDSETGLNYYNARYYDSHIRRFTQPDSIIQNVYNPQDLNKYAYVRNNPLKYTDPSGHVTCNASGCHSDYSVLRPQPKKQTSPAVSKATPYYSAVQNASTKLPSPNNHSKPSQSTQQNTQSSPPTIVDLNKNIAEAQKNSWNKAWFPMQVMWGGSMDYNTNFGTEYQGLGNYSYGAVGRASGYDTQTLQKMGGVVQWLTNKYRDIHPKLEPVPVGGKVWTEYPYNDSVEPDGRSYDQENISAGMYYYDVSY